MVASWIHTKLGTVARVIMGQAPLGSTYNEKNQGLPLIAGAGDLSATYPNPVRWTTSPIQVCQTGDLIFCVRATIGVMNWADKEYCLGRGVAAIRPNNDLIDSEYLYYCLAAHSDEILRFASGSTFIQIRRQDLETLSVPLPPLPEQRRIAAILREADEIRKLRQEANEKTQKIVEALFYDMFGDPAINPKQWRIARVDSLFPEDRRGITTGPFGSLLKKNELVKEGIPVWGINNVQPNKFVEKNSYFISEQKYEQLIEYRVQKEDILISRAGTVGRMCVAYPSVPCSIIGTNLIRIVLNEALILPEYFTTLFTYFQERVGNLRASGEESSYSFLNPRVLKATLIPVPTLALQKEFVAITFEIRSEEQQQNILSEKSKELYQSLLSRAFTGELTASWREQHMEELTQAARERDTLLQRPTTTLIEEMPVLILPQEEETEREDLIDQLSLLQKTLLDIFLRNRQSYFTANQLYEDHEEALQEKRLRASLDQVRRELRTLAALGLIREITLRVTDQPGRVDYATVYRYPQPDDNTMSEDLERLATRSL